MSSFNVYLERNFDSASELNNMTSYYVIASSKLYPEVGDDYTALCNLGGRSSVARAVLP